MWFSLFAVVLILAITFYQGLHGLFSAVIMCILTVLASALAFGLYENVFFAFLVDRQPEHGRAIAMMSIFIVSLLVLRVLADALIKNNQTYPMYVDRAGGGLFGFITAMIMVGMLTIGFQMLPFHDTFLGFERYTLVDASGQPVKLRDPADPNSLPPAHEGLRLRRNSVWLSPGQFTATLAGYLSDNALRGETPMSEVYPDFMGTLHHLRADMSPDDRHLAGRDGLTVEGYWDVRPEDVSTPEYLIDGSTAKVRYKPVKGDLPSGSKRMAVRVALDVEKTKSTGGKINFVPEQVRLVAREREGGPAKEFFLTAMSSPHNASRTRHMFVTVHPGELISLTPTGGSERVDFVFTVPESTGFKPLYIDFKLDARAEWPASRNLNEKPPAPVNAAAAGGGNTAAPGNNAALPVTPSPGTGSSTPTAAPPPTNGITLRPGQVNTADQRNRVSSIGRSSNESKFTDELPFTLTNYGAIRKEGTNPLVSGQINAVLDNNWVPIPGTMPPISRFAVPENERLLQLSATKHRPESWLGGILGQARDKIGDIYVLDASGKEHRFAGTYMVAEINGQWIFELNYLNPQESEFGHAPKFDFGKIKRSDLKGDYALYYLFRVPPGTHITRLNTGGQQQVDLTADNLVAPN